MARKFIYKLFAVLSVVSVWQCTTSESPPRENIGAGPTDASTSTTVGPIDVPDTVPNVVIAGRSISVEGVPLVIRGVCWNPVGKGGVHPRDLDFAGFAERDAALMAAAGINAIRTYEPILDRTVLDKLWSHGIYVLNTVYPWGGDAAEAVDNRVKAVRDHPAVLMWIIGNEWNYNGLFNGLSFDVSVARVEEVAARIKRLDSRPVVTIYGEIPTASTIQAIPSVDVWGINAYRGLSFGNLFSEWANVSDKPMFLSEYGADAYDARIPGVNLEAQAEATLNLTQELIDQHFSRDGVVFGGTVFEWADEWWKASGGSPNVQDPTGMAPGGGPHPDRTFNEEWWGIVDIDRQPRPAYDTLRKLYRP